MPMSEIPSWMNEKSHKAAEPETMSLNKKLVFNTYPFNTF